MQKQRIFLISGAILALVAVFMVKTYLDQQRQVIAKQEKQRLEKIQASRVSVLVASREISAGTLITPEMVGTVSLSNKEMEPRAVTDLYRIDGMMTIASIRKGEQITLDKLSQVRQAGGLAEVTPVGKRAITISVDNISALAGMIKPGDYTDVIAMIPVPMQTPEGKQVNQVAVLPLFQNVLVLAVGQETGGLDKQAARYKKEERKDISPFITLALSPQETNFLAFIQEQGKIRLVLRSPADSGVQPVQPANWDSLFQYILPQKKEAPVKSEEREKRATVEIIRGLSKEKIPLSN